VIRNYDPCISCATHFLDLNLIRDGIIENTKHKPNTTPCFENIDLSKSAIIGIGSPIIDDDLGWQAVDILQENKNIQTLMEKGLRLFILDRPGVLLAESIRDYDHVIIIDAISPENQTTLSTWINVDKLDSVTNRYSSHDIGLTDSLQYIKSIESLPNDIALLAISEINCKKLIGDILQCLNY
ncbi:MAG: hydrogenase maturation protease, partial [Gammaproteobacteria bacterium]|nr:hydrogenase maturation protease [Gammaproteobacteria bacterium]